MFCYHCVAERRPNAHELGTGIFLPDCATITDSDDIILGRYDTNATTGNSLDFSTSTINYVCYNDNGSEVSSS